MNRGRTAPSGLLDSALDAARRGWPVVLLHGIQDSVCTCPKGLTCKDAGKHPRLTGWKDEATTDEDAISEWWRRAPASNLGVLTGARAGIFALDIDPRSGGDVELAILEARHGRLPHSVEQLTGGGGRHVFLVHPGWPVRNRPLAPGPDIKGDGGFIVLAPSRHRSGRNYVFELSSHPDDVGLAPAPGWLLGLLSPNGELTGALPLDERIPEGERNATLISLAGTMRRRGMTEGEILVALREVNRRRCRPPLDEAEVQTIAASVSRYAPAAPSGDKADPGTTQVGLRVLPWSEMASGPASPVPYHWEGWIARGSVALLAGAGEAYKSWLAMHLAVATAAGRPVLADEPGPAIAPGPVLYVTAENPEDEEKRRCGLLKAGLRLPEELPISFVIAESPCLGNATEYAALIELVTQIRPVAIFVDSAIAVSGLQNENDNSAVRAFMQSRILPLARRHGATVYVIVHSPKPPMQPGARFSDEHVARGAGDWRNAADIVLYLKRDPSLAETAVVLRHAKCRIGRRHAPIWFHLDVLDPDKAVRLAYGGTYAEETGQGNAATVLSKTISTAITMLKENPEGLYLRDLQSRLSPSGKVSTTARRATDVLRGRQPWPGGPHRGKKQSVLDEEKHGVKVLVRLDATRWVDAPDEGAL